MSDPIDKLLDAAESGKSIIKNRDILHFTYIPNIILHRDSEQKQVTQSLLPILKQSRPSNLLDMYKGILLVNSGSWQKQTPFQASVGMTPNPGIAIMVNLKTFQVFHQNYNSNSDNILQS